MDKHKIRSAGDSLRSQVPASRQVLNKRAKRKRAEPNADQKAAIKAQKPKITNLSDAADAAWDKMQSNMSAKAARGLARGQAKPAKAAAMKRSLKRKRASTRAGSLADQARRRLS